MIITEIIPAPDVPGDLASLGAIEGVAGVRPDGVAEVTWVDAADLIVAVDLYPPPDPDTYWLPLERLPCRG